MTITSTQIYSAISHYQKTNGVTLSHETSNIEFIIEAMRTQSGNERVGIEEIEGLGDGVFVLGHGTYIPIDSNKVLFLQEV